MPSGSTKQTTQVGANKRRYPYTGNGGGEHQAGNNYDFFLSYPLKRAPSGSEDSFLIQSVRYIANQDASKMKRGKTLTADIGLNQDEKGEVPFINDKGKLATEYDEQIKKGKMSFSMGGGKDMVYNAHDGLGGAAKFGKDTNFYVELPIPRQVQDGNAVQWGANSMNLFTLAGMDLAAKVMADPKSALSDIQTIYNTLIKSNKPLETLNIESDSEIGAAVRASLAGAAVNVFGANVTPNTVMSRALGKILNGNKELLFDGVTLREFKFDFTFTPRSSDEGERARKIIRQLKRSMSPKAGKEYQGGGAFGSGGGIFLNSPDLFLLRYLSGGRDHPFLNSFKPCALTSLSVNYTGGGTYATYSDSTPVHMKVSMVFKETNPIYNEDYDNENVGGVGF
tara:strand:- start:1015 stop:2199 length:1185 start_codon:yes stop_codon:yes gene_type:complete